MNLTNDLNERNLTTNSRKPAFSYLELVFSMVIVVIVLSLSLPLLTRRSKAPTNSTYGEFRCYTAYNAETNSYDLLEQYRYNSDTLSAPKKVNTCQFSRPSNVIAYSITLSGGGGGGSKTLFETEDNEHLEKNIVSQSSDFQTHTFSGGTVNNVGNGFNLGSFVKYSYISGSYLYTYTFKTLSFYVNGFQWFTTYPALKNIIGQGGKSGETVTFKSTLAGVWNSSNKLEITMCDNSPDADNETACVGAGGLHGQGTELANYYSVLAIAQDAKYLLTKKTGYTTSGDSAIDINDISVLQQLLSATEDTDETNYLNAMISAIQSYISTSSTAYLTTLHTNAVNYLNYILTKNITAKSDGYDGVYTHFFVADAPASVYCKSGNCILKGGVGGRSSTASFDYVSSPKQYGSYYCYQTEYEKNSIENLSRLGTFAPLVAKTESGYAKCEINSSDLDLTNCSSSQPIELGTGGGGGDYAFCLNTRPQSFSRIRMIDSSGAPLNSMYDYIVSDESVGVESDEQDFSTADIKLINGNGISGGGGAIIITW